MTLKISIGLVLIALVAGFPVHAQDGGGTVTHVVQPDENLYRIALHYNITVEALMQANGLTDADLVVVGSTLIIPVSGPVPTVTAVSSASVRRHTVAPGETLSQIARRYGVTLDDLIRANHIVNASLITVGQELIIPGSPSTVMVPSDLGFVGVEIEFAPVQTEPPSDLGILSADSAPAPAAVPPTSVQEPVPPPATSVPVHEPIPSAEPPVTSPVSPADNPSTETAPELVFDTAPDLGILPSGAASDLGDTASWLVQPGIFLTGDAHTVREIYLRGLALGNNPHAFSKVGDCNSETPFFLAKFDTGEYNLGRYGYLQPVIDQFAGSYRRQSLAVWTGNHAWAVFDPTWSNPAYCQAGETPLACEFRLNRPSLVLIRLGTNEAGDPVLFENNLRLIIDFAIEHGTIPVLGTKADRLEGSDRNNDIVRALAAEYGVPLWDFGHVADTLPARGLLADGFHMTYIAPDYTAPAAMQTGHSVQNLMALMILNTVWRNAMY